MSQTGPMRARRPAAGSRNAFKTFIEQMIQPRLAANQLTEIQLAAPDLAFIGSDASEFRRFLPTLMSLDVDIAAYHMYDSYQND